MRKREEQLIPLAQKCKRIREFCNITLGEVSEETGYSKQNISHFEHGRTDSCIILYYYVTLAAKRGLLKWLL